MYKSAFAKTQKSALKQLHQLLDLYRDVDLTEECRMTLGEWMDKWLDEYMIFTIKENTIKGYRSQIDHQIKPFIGHKQLASLTTADIQKFYNKIKKEGRVHPHPIHGHVLSDSMVRKIHMMLHEAMEVAVRERYIVRNPTDNTTIPKKTITEKQVLDDSQLNRFLEAIQGEPYWHDFFYVEVMTGLRRGEIPLCKLSQNDLQQFYANLKKNGRLQYSETCGTGVSNRLVRSCHARCRSALEKAVSENLITRNPSLGCKLPPKKGREMQVLTPAEIGRFLARAKEEGYYELFLLELSTGMRRGEILGLKWSDLNLTDGSLRIAREVVPAGGKIVIQPPKTKNSIRTVVLPPYMVAILAEMKKSKTCEWIFPSPVKQGEPRNPTAIHRRFKLILERSGCKNIRFHDLRHTFATMALENGMNVKVLSDMIGHISAETTLNIYSHVTDTMRTQASVKIDRKIGGTDAPMPEAKVEPRIEETSAVDENFEPWQPKYRKPGTGCVYQINDSLWEGSFYPRLADGNRKKFNVYAKTREECEEALAKMIAEKKAEIAAEKAKMKTA